MQDLVVPGFKDPGAYEVWKDAATASCPGNCGAQTSKALFSRASTSNLVNVSSTSKMCRRLEEAMDSVQYTRGVVAEARYESAPH